MAKPNQAQMAFNGKMPGANKAGLRRALQIVRCRGFVYDGSLAPVCLSCGGLREDRKGMRCDRCQRSR